MSALGDVFELSVVISAIDKWTAPMRKMTDSMKYSQQNMDAIAKSMKNIGSTSAEIDKVSAAMDKWARSSAWDKIAQDMKATKQFTQEQIDQMGEGYMKMAQQQEELANRQAKAQEKFQSAMKLTAIGAGITLGGVGLADMLAKAAEKAGELQQAVVGVGSSMKLTNDQMQTFGNMAMTLGIPTKFSAVQTSGLLQAMYSAGLPKNQIFNSGVASQYINFADIQEYMKHENGADVVSNAVGMAHQYQLYSADQISPFLNDLNAILVQSHQTMSEFATQYNYVAAQAKRSGMSSTEALDATAWLSRMGFGSGRGGTNFADFLMRSYLGSGGNKADAAMQAAGFVQNGHSVFYDAKGNFVGIPQASMIMQDFFKRYGNNMNAINPIMQAIWGTQGARVAGALGSSGAVDQWNLLKKSQASTADIKTMQETMNMTLGGQWTQFKTTLEDLVTVFGQQLIPILTNVLHFVNQILAKFLEFAQAHPQLVKIAAVVATIAAGMALIVGPMLAVIGMIGMLSAGFAAVGGVISGALLVVPAVLAAIAGGAYLLYKNWDTVKKDVKPITDALGITSGGTKPARAGGAQPVDDGTAGQAGPFRQMGDKFKSTYDEIAKTSKSTWQEVAQDMKDAASFMMPYMNFWGTTMWYSFKIPLDAMLYSFKFLFDQIMDLSKMLTDSLSATFAFFSDLAHGDFTKAQQDWTNGWKNFSNDISLMGNDMKLDFNSFANVIGQDMADAGINIAKSFVENFGSSAAFGIDNFFQSHPTLMKMMQATSWGQSILSTVQQAPSDSASSNDGVGHHYKAYAAGGIITSPHFGLVGEAGPEAIIPLTKRARGLQLWQQAGRALGVNLAGGGGGVNINIYPLPHQSPTEIAQAVSRELGTVARGKVRNSGMRVNRTIG